MALLFGSASGVSIGHFGIALATVILPNLQSHAAEKHDEFSASLDSGLRWVMVIGIPAAAGLYFWRRRC